jgi:hypothetical protein
MQVSGTIKFYGRSQVNKNNNILYPIDDAEIAGDDRSVFKHLVSTMAGSDLKSAQR